MNIHFLFPSHPSRSSLVDEMFAEQLTALEAAGFTVSLCPDSVIQDGKPLRHVPPGVRVVYRGWMLNASGYEKLAAAMTGAGATPFTPLDSYLAAHHLPNWYPLIAEFTPETRVLTAANAEEELRALGWDAYFIKDYVKSLKTSRGSIIHNSSEIGPLLAEMERFRGEIEGGLCVRRVEPFVAETERRYFVLKGKSFSAKAEPAPPIVERIAARIPSPFFSVDVVRRADGDLRIVEIGDGQVSDLVGWSASAFAKMWKVGSGLITEDK